MKKRRINSFSNSKLRKVIERHYADHLVALLDEQHSYEFEEAKLNYQSDLDLLVLDKEIELAEKSEMSKAKFLAPT